MEWEVLFIFFKRLKQLSFSANSSKLIRLESNQHIPEVLLPFKLLIKPSDQILRLIIAMEIIALKILFNYYINII